MTALSKVPGVRALIMAAGTGGHIYPGIALGQALRARGVVVEWLGTPNGMEQRLDRLRGLICGRSICVASAQKAPLRG